MERNLSVDSMSIQKGTAIVGNVIDNITKPMERNLSVELRPQTLDDFVGSQNVINAVKEQIKQGRVDSTYVISGPPGTGKTSLARAIIHYVNGPLEYYDIDEPDTSELSADTLRATIATSRFSPQWGDYKGIIIDEAHKLRTDVQTLLLKATEEPPPGTIWFICSSMADKLDGALRRRGSHLIMQGINAVETKELIFNALSHIGGEVRNKYVSQTDALVSALGNQEVTSPGLIVRAVEKWVTGATAEEAALVSEVTTVDTFAISKACAFGQWSTLQTLLQAAPRSAARDIRGNTAGFFRSMLVKEAAGSKKAERCVWAIEILAGLSNQSAYEEGLIWASTCAALYKICAAQKELASKR